MAIAIIALVLICIGTVSATDEIQDGNLTAIDNSQDQSIDMGELNSGSYSDDIVGSDDNTVSLANEKDDALNAYDSYNQYCDELTTLTISSTVNAASVNNVELGSTVSIHAEWKSNDKNFGQGTPAESNRNIDLMKNGVLLLSKTGTYTTLDPYQGTAYFTADFEITFDSEGWWNITAHKDKTSNAYSTWSYGAADSNQISFYVPSSVTNSGELTLTVNGFDGNIKASLGNYVIFDINRHELGQVNVEFYLNDELFDDTAEDSYSIVFDETDPNPTTVYVKYGDIKSNIITLNFVTATPTSVKLNTDNSKITVGDTAVIYVNVTDDNGNPINFGLVGIYDTSSINQNTEPIAEINVGEIYEYTPTSSGSKKFYAIYYSSCSPDAAYAQSPASLSVSNLIQTSVEINALSPNSLSITGNGETGEINMDEPGDLVLKAEITGMYSVYENGEYNSTISIYDNDEYVGYFTSSSWYRYLKDFTLTLTEGKHEIYAYYTSKSTDSNNVYAPCKSNILTVNVAGPKPVNNLKIEIESVDYPNEVIAKVTSSQVGTYNITVGSKIIPIKITEEDNGFKEVSLGKFDVNDNYEVVITSDDDSTLTNNTSFAVTKGTLVLDVTVVGNNTEINIGDKTITVSTDADDATGNVQLFEDGTQIGADKNLGESIDISTLTEGTHTITVKYINDNNYDAEDKVITFVVNLPEIETNVYLELNTTEVRVNGKILVIAHVYDEKGNEIKTGDVKIYTRSDFRNADPIKTITAGESFEFIVDSNSFSTYQNPYRLYSRYMGQTTDDMIYKESSNTTGSVYYHASSNSIELKASELNIYTGQSVDIQINVNGAGVVTLFVNGEENGTVSKGTTTLTLNEAKDYEFQAVYIMTTNDYYASCVSEKVTVHVIEATTPVVQINLDKDTVSKDGIITVTPTVTGGSGDKGIVKFYDENDNPLGEIDLNTNTTFDYKVTGESGIHSIYAKYVDNNNAFPESSSDKKEYKIKSTLTITLSRNDDGIVVIGDTVYFTITFSDSVSDNLELWINGAKFDDEDGTDSTSIKFDKESDVGENNILIKFLGNDDFDAAESNIVTINVVKPLDTSVTIELTPDAVLPNKNITITPTVTDEKGNVVTSGVVKVYTDAYMNSDPVAVINVGETGNYSDTKNYPGHTDYLYAVYIPSDRTYNRSPVSSGVKYTLLYSNKLDLTVNSGSEITVNDGVSFNILATLTGGDGEITLYINNNANITLTKNTETQMILPVGDYTIYAKYARGSDNYDSSISNTVTVHVVEKVQNEIKVTVESITLPNKAEIKVTATVDGEYTIDVNGTEVKVTVNGGNGSEFVSLPAGDYYANVTGQEDATITNAVFTVSPEPEIGKLIIRDADYPNNQTITVTGEGNVTISIEYFVKKILDNPLTNQIIFNVGGQTKYVENPAYEQYTPVSFSIVINETSDFTINATYKVWGLMDGQYSVESNVLTYSVTVIPPAKEITLNVEVDEEQNEDDLYQLDWGDSPFEIVTTTSEEIDASIIYKEGDKELGRAKAGETFEIDPNDLGLGKHTITAVLDGNDNVNYTFTLEVLVKTIWFTLEIDNVTYPDHAVGKFYSDVDGKYTIIINGEEYEVNFVWTDVDEPVSFDIKQLPVGTYTPSSIIFEDLEHYEFGESEIEGQNSLPTFSVKSEVTLNDTVLSVVNGTAPAFSIDLPGASGNLTVTVDGKNYTKELVDGKASVEISDLPAGDYTATVTYTGDETHKSSSVPASFKVEEKTSTKDDVVLNDTVLSVSNGTSPVFSIDLPGASGNLTVSVNGKNYTKELVDGKASVEISDLPAGDYTATVTYTGDETHKSSSVPANFKVDEKETPDVNKTFDVNVPEGSTNPVFSINLPGATGNFTVTVDGKNYTKELVNGSASITIDDLTPGDHNITVSYSGDKNYSPITKNTTVNIPTPKLTNNKNINAVYSSNAYYKVRVTVNGKAVVGEKVSFKFNGKTYNVKTDKNGYATLKLPTKIKAKKYTITATFKGVKVSNKVTVKHLIIAKNLKAKKSKKVLKIKVKTNKVNGKFLKGKKLKLKLKGKTLKAKINKKGVATFKVKKNILKKLKVGKKYTYKVTYGKDTVAKKIKIKR